MALLKLTFSSHMVIDEKGKAPALDWGSGTVSGLPQAERKPSWRRTCRSRRCSSAPLRSDRICDDDDDVENKDGDDDNDYHEREYVEAFPFVQVTSVDDHDEDDDEYGDDDD